MKVYFIGRYSLGLTFREFAAALAREGVETVSRWIYGTHDIGDHPTAEQRARLAEENMNDLFAADTVICFTEDVIPPGSRNRGAHHVEWGLAIAWRKQRVLIGPAENVFHCLGGTRQFASWQAAFEFLRPRSEYETTDFHAETGIGQTGGSP